MHHRQHGDYNKETSIYISQLNPRCKEEDIIEELNLILRDHRVTRDKNLSKAQQNEENQSEVKNVKPMNNFILSSIVS